VNNIETIIFLILLFMGVPALCRKLGRPALANAFFVLFGLALTPVVEKDVVAMLVQAGEVGFLLVLFEVGLEIELPRLRQFLAPLRFAVLWAAVQYPIVYMLATLAGLTLPEALLAAAAIAGCAVSMAHPGWKAYPGLSPEPRTFVLQVMVALELLAIILLGVGTVALERGIGWTLLARLAGIVVVIGLISRFAVHLVRTFQWIIEKATHWRVHFLVLLVLLVCAVGDRLGLSAAKTAFFLGLFMSRARHEGMNIEDYIAPISRRFLIPIFFVSLGLLIKVKLLLDYTALLALCGAFLLIGFRGMIHRRWLKTGGDDGAYLLLCPNLTMAALAAKSMLNVGRLEAATWTVLVGLFVSIGALAFLPKSRPDATSPAAA
jgi:Kef-type K+ transport system membrane component KefB